MLSKKKNAVLNNVLSNNITPTFASRFFSDPIPKYDIPDKGIGSDVAYQLIHDELNMDGNPSLNLASFVTTWMDSHAEKLIIETINKNLVDQDEYPQTGVIQERIVNMLARLFNAPESNQYMGTATVGSSEAIMLGLLAHKWNFRKKMQMFGKDGSKPNIVIGADVHVVWEKFARYFDVEMKIIPMKKRKYILDVNDVEKNIDENTICVGAVLGTTFTGQLDPIEEINEMLINVKNKKGWDIPIHVDGASGGFVVPFLYPDLKWDFRLSHVRSINVSGHKYGLVYPGLGWLIFKDKTDLPEDLIFYVNYLGGEEATYTLNFSRGSSMMIAQYYNLLMLGKDGYNRIMKNAFKNAVYLLKKIKEIDFFEPVIENIKLPIITVSIKKNAGFNVFQLSAKLKERGWIVPAYNLPKDAEDVEILRIVVKENFSGDMADILVSDIIRFSKELTGNEIAVNKTDKEHKKLSTSNSMHKHIC
ncbi:MAG: glutamate decarboxylase [bacterium]